MNGRHVALVMTSGNAQFSGGVPAVVLQRARYLVRAGVEVSVVCMGEPGFLGHIEQEGFHVYPQHVRHRMEAPFRKMATLSPWYLRSLGRGLAEAHARRAVDLIDLQDGPAVLGVGPFVRKQAVPMVFTFNSSALLNPAPRPKIGRMLHVSYERQASNLARRVLLVSEAMRPAAQRYGVPEDRIQVVSNTVPPDVFDRGEKRPSEPPALPLRLLFLGRIDAGKRLEVAVRALARLPKDAAFLDVVGDGPLASSARVLAESLKVSDRVRFHGQVVDRSAVLDALQRADVLVFPSIFESFGLAVIEAMAAGCYPLVTDVEPMRSMLPPEHRFPSDDVEALAERLRAIAAAPGLVEQARPRLREAARAYETDRVYPLLIQAYEKALELR